MSFRPGRDFPMIPLADGHTAATWLISPPHETLYSLIEKFGGHFNRAEGFLAES